MARILVIEDYPPLAKVIAIGLGRRQHQVARVGSAQRALEAEGGFDVAIADIDLPDGNGVETAEQLLDEGRVDRVVFFSATRDLDVHARALRLGPLLDKSQGVEALLDLVDEELRHPAMAKVVGAPDAPVGRASGRSGTRRRVR
jgi:two-component system, OmpR family, KDP operon response regulator KdpE